MVERSNRPEVRNPILALPAARRIADLPPEARDLVADLLREIAADAQVRAQESWKKNKGPMAAYWKAVGAYAKHMRHAFRRTNMVQRHG